MTILGWWICLAAILDQKDSSSPPLMSSINSLFESFSFIVYPLSFLILLIILTTKFFAFSSYACALSTAERFGLESSSLLFGDESASEPLVESSLEANDYSVDSLVTSEYSGDVGDFEGLAVLVLDMF